MGSFCSKSSNEPDAFAQPGRVLGSGQNPQKGTTSSSSGPRAPLPKSNWGTPGRTLGGAGEPSTTPSTSSPDTADARTNAAIAAQKRAESATTARKGKLGSKLAAQKARPPNQTLNEVSREERAARDADEAAAAQRWE
ncbi:hypothetical protein BDV59DRAFT_176412 [Aspergillus ambiguus]|uniref:uncharacterized protein n=1 Tax=Aspergillus ambiguus TaxID=176160 RepID=UPI003CCE5051